MVTIPKIPKIGLEQIHPVGKNHNFIEKKKWKNYKKTNLKPLTFNNGAIPKELFFYFVVIFSKQQQHFRLCSKQQQHFRNLVPKEFCIKFNNSLSYYHIT